MDVLSLLLLAVGLSMDATAVAAARGLSLERVTLRHVLLVSLFFGGSQALMPLLGWFAGQRFVGFIEHWDHWLAFALLSFIGAKMLRDGFRPDEPEAPREEEGDPFALPVLAVLAVATSIDALAAGLTLTLLRLPVALCVATIGVTTALLSTAGLYAGRRFGAHLGARLELWGGAILLLLGVKILVEHLLGTA